VKAGENLSDEAALTRAISLLVPGVILQPSGVFAAIRAQQEGCIYLRAS
jgi:intracellular sulfur oxidation DsrE/DsrF family protein